ncbi:RNA polymerase-binding protein DksA [Leeia oryzae]|uniref:RNA polymerase-binding protein DksA n=1 Tax=Leeia oryzae TaxID=356662 RepID=UPI0003776F1C|nr:RNA polymerase-binding protein DksA [Leeia oryzae]
MHLTPDTIGIAALPGHQASRTDPHILTTEQLAYLHALLCQERDTLLSSANDTMNHLQILELTPDPSDRASQEEDHSLELRVRDRERKHLHMIDEAIKRIHNGTYGYCVETGEPIQLERLLARPTATLSIEAQERHEYLQRQQRAYR